MYDPDELARDYIESCGGCAQELPEDFVLIDPCDELPPYPKWKINPMYKYDTRGVRWVWQTGFDGLSIWTLYGPLSSTSIATTIVKLASSSTLSGQALIVCNTNYIDKYRDGYLFLGDTRERQFKCMKGNRYVPGETKLRFPVVLDVKLDGIRAHCRLVDGVVEMKSYNNKEMSHIVHISEQVRDLFAYLPQGTVVDGELYKHGLNLRQIQSIVRSDVNTHHMLKEINYYVFDIACPERTVIEDRYPALVRSFNSFKKLSCPNVMLVEKWYAWSYEEVSRGFEQSIDMGFEGVMIRQSSINRKEGTREWEMSKYSYSRTNSLFKYKKYESMEGIVVAVADTKGKEKKMCKLVVRLDNGYDLSARFGTAEEKKMWKENPSLVIGKVLKIEYPEINVETGVPQRAVGLCLRDPIA